MEFELNKFGPNSRSTVLNKIKQYKLDVEIIQKDLVKKVLFFDLKKKKRFKFY
jgi:hypothetical protein